MTEPLATAPTGTDEAAWGAACAAVRAYCGWHIAPQVTETLTLDGPGGTLLVLPSLHVEAVTSVTNNGEPVTDPEWSTAGMIRGAYWSEKFRGVTVTLTHGYEAVPDDVFAVLEHMTRQAAYIARAPEAGVAGMFVSGPHTMQVSPSALAGAVGLSGQHRGVLNRYKLPPRP